jgi:hypothetical protein
MIEDTLKKMENRLAGLSALPEDRQAELTALLAELRAEISELSRTHQEQAESIARLAELSAHEATRTHRNPALQQVSLKGLSTSVDGFEASHPRLVEAVNSLCLALSNLGI